MKKITKSMLGIAAAVLSFTMGATALIGCNGGKDYVFEAEDAELAGAAQVEENKHEWNGIENIGSEDAEAISVVGYFGQDGDTITWTINASKACTATITVKAASAVNGFETGALDIDDTFEGEGWKTLAIDTSKNEVFTLSVNGTQAKLSGTLPGLEVSIEDLGTLGMNMWSIFDNGYNNHGTCTAKVKLKEGENTVVIAAVSQGVNVDKITIKASAELTAKQA